MWKYNILLFLLFVSCASDTTKPLPFNPSEYELIDWSNDCVQDYLHRSLKEGERIKPLELILIQKRMDVCLAYERIDGTEKVDTVFGSIKVFDHRNDFNERVFTGKGVNSFLALSLAFLKYNAWGDSCYSERTYTLDENGNVINDSEYISPKEVLSRQELEFARAIKLAMDAMGKDTSKVHLTIEGKEPGVIE